MSKHWRKVFIAAAIILAAFALFVILSLLSWLHSF